MNYSLATLGFGFILGVQHAFEPDHVIAVATLITEHKKPTKAALAGAFWGVGHTTTLFTIGLIVLILKISIPERLNLFAELLVGIMLVFLGIRAISQGRFLIHKHPHSHEDLKHTHIHAHRESQKDPSHKTKSFLVGVFHGLAGSGALMVLVLSTISTILEGMYYVLLFGMGSILGMTIMSFLLSLPLSYSTQKFINVEKDLRNLAGGASVIFGIYIIYTVSNLLR